MTKLECPQNTNRQPVAYSNFSAGFMSKQFTVSSMFASKSSVLLNFSLNSLKQPS